LNLQRAIDFRVSLSKFAQVQAQAAKACADVWTSVVVDMEQASHQQQQQHHQQDAT
jgi:hypothetical protein